MEELGTCSNFQLGDLIAMDGWDQSGQFFGVRLCMVIGFEPFISDIQLGDVVRLVWLDSGKVGRKYSQELRLISRAHKEKIGIEGAAN